MFFFIVYKISYEFVFDLVCDYGFEILQCILSQDFSHLGFVFSLVYGCYWFMAAIECQIFQHFPLVRGRTNSSFGFHFFQVLEYKR